MVTIPHGLRGWWRYSGLTLVPFATRAVVTLCLWGIAFITGRRAVTVIAASVMTALVAAVLIAGAIKAERARKHGCW